MCHVWNLTYVNQQRLRALPQEYRAKLEDALENRGYVPSTREAVTPIFEAIYGQWQAREAAVREARSATREVVLPVYVGGEKITVLTSILEEANR